MGLQTSKKSTKLIALSNSLFVEVDAPDDYYAEKSSRFAEPIRGSFELAPLVVEIFHLFKNIPKNTYPDQLEIEVNIGIDAEGQPYLAKKDSESNIGIKMTYSRKE